jgi:hypothetical protein
METSVKAGIPTALEAQACFQNVAKRATAAGPTDKVGETQPDTAGTGAKRKYAAGVASVPGHSRRGRVASKPGHVRYAPVAIIQHRGEMKRWANNRAVVVGCAISATRNSLKLHMPRTLKVLLCNPHAKTRKLWSVLPSCRRSKQYPSINSPRHPLRPRLPRYPLHDLRFPGMQTLYVASCSRRAYHRERRWH